MATFLLYFCAFVGICAVFCLSAAFIVGWWAARDEYRRGKDPMPDIPAPDPSAPKPPIPPAGKL